MSVQEFLSNYCPTCVAVAARACPEIYSWALTPTVAHDESSVSVIDAYKQGAIRTCLVVAGCGSGHKSCATTAIREDGEVDDGMGTQNWAGVGKHIPKSVWDNELKELSHLFVKVIAQNVDAMAAWLDREEPTIFHYSQVAAEGQEERQEDTKTAFLEVLANIFYPGGWSAMSVEVYEYIVHRYRDYISLDADDPYNLAGTARQQNAALFQHLVEMYSHPMSESHTKQTVRALMQQKQAGAKYINKLCENGICQPDQVAEVVRGLPQRGVTGKGIYKHAVAQLVADGVVCIGDVCCAEDVCWPRQ